MTQSPLPQVCDLWYCQTRKQQITMSRNYTFHYPEGLYFFSFAVVHCMGVFDKVEYGECSSLILNIKWNLNANRNYESTYRIFGRHLRKVTDLR